MQEDATMSLDDRPKFGACGWREDCTSAALYSVKPRSLSGVCEYHRSVDDRSLGGYHVTWYHTVKVCRECGAPATVWQRRDHVKHWFCDAHKLPPVVAPEVAS